MVKKRFQSIQELEDCFKSKGATILAYLDENNEEMTPPDPPPLTQIVRWTCANNKSHIVESKLSVTLRGDHPKLTCLSCGRRKFNSVDELLSLFETKGSQLMAIIEDGQEKPVNHIPNTKMKIKWSCANNPTHIQVSSLGSVISGNRDRYLCRSCAISSARGGQTHNSFSDLLKKRGWEMVSKDGVYKNNKSVVVVKCENGHLIQTTENRFSAGHGCKQCANQRQRKHTIEEITKEFKDKGFILLEKEYLNNSTLMDYICKCGRQRKISYSNFTANVDGCKECSKRWMYSEVEEVLEDMGCTLLSADGGSKEFILNSTILEYVCICKTKHSSTWRLFKNGARCPECTKKTIRETCLGRYGVDNPSKSEHVKQKIRNVMIELYGVEYAMQKPEFVEKPKRPI